MLKSFIKIERVADFFSFFISQANHIRKILEDLNRHRLLLLNQAGMQAIFQSLLDAEKCWNLNVFESCNVASKYSLQSIIKVDRSALRILRYIKRIQQSRLCYYFREPL